MYQGTLNRERSYVFENRVIKALHIHTQVLYVVNISGMFQRQTKKGNTAYIDAAVVVHFRK